MANKQPKVARPMKFLAAAMAILIIIGLLIIMIVGLYTQTSSLLGLTQEPIVNCTDTDGGNIQTEFGTCTDSGRQQHNDNCVLTGLREEYKLQEWFCNTTTNTCQSEIVNCVPGFMCTVGKCVVA